VPNTNDASSKYDAISYKKGATFIKQMSNFVGKDHLIYGLHDFFQKFSLKTSTLEDFV
jgi:aminopeptidase N